MIPGQIGMGGAPLGNLFACIPEDVATIGSGEVYGLHNAARYAAAFSADASPIATGRPLAEILERGAAPL
jgi:hypothetical protein